MGLLENMHELPPQGWGSPASPVDILEFELADGLLGDPLMARGIVDRIREGTATANERVHLDMQRQRTLNDEIDQIMGYGAAGRI